MSGSNKREQAKSIIVEAKERFDGIKQYTDTSDVEGPIDPQFGNAICSVIYDTIRAVLTAKDIVQKGNLLRDYAISLEEGLNPPQISENDAKQFHFLYTDYEIAISQGITIDRPSYIKYAGKFITWAEGSI